MKFNRFEEIDVWKQSRLLVKEIYSISEQMPFAKDFSFKDQIRRSAFSIPSNMAEGYERKSNTEFIRFLYIVCQDLLNIFNQLSDKCDKFDEFD